MATINAGGVVLPDEVTADITAAAQEPLPASNTPTPQFQTTALPGGVSAIPVDASTYLQITVVPNPSFPNPAGGVTVFLTAKILQPSGTITNCLYTYTFSITAGLLQVSDMAPGYLLAVAVSVGTAFVPDGALYAVVGLLHQPNSGQPLDALLISGYVSSLQPTGWPEAILRTVSDGNGWSFGLRPTSPALGADWIYQVVDAQLELTSVALTLTAAVTVANRYVTIYISVAGGSEATVGACATAQTAGTAVEYQFSAGLPASSITAAGIQFCTLANPILLNAEGVMGTDTNGLQAGDQISNIALTGRAWI